MPGDTMVFAAAYPVDTTRKVFNTLHLWIEDVHHVTTWKLRYPMLNGYAEGAIILPAGLPADMYGVHASVQRDFLNVTGFVNNKRLPTKLNYVLMGDSKETQFHDVKVDSFGYFQIPRLLFPNNAHFFFSPDGKKQRNDLEIILNTSVDSAFHPIVQKDVLLTIGNIEPGPVAKEYQFNPSVFTGETTLKDVVVTARKKDAAEKFNDQFVSGLFKGDGMMFSNLDGGPMSGFANVLDYLTGRVAGLTINQNGGQRTISWRGGATSVFVDEVAVDIDYLSAIPTSDIAIVKVFRPPFFGAVGGGAGGAIAIYTRRANDGGPQLPGPKNAFLVHGYTPLEYKLPYGKPAEKPGE